MLTVMVNKYAVVNCQTGYKKAVFGFPKNIDSEAK